MGGAYAPPKRRSGALWTLALIGAALAALALPGAARAGGGDGLLVEPHPFGSPQLSYFRLLAVPGTSVRAGVIELRNPTARTIRASLAAVGGRTLSTLGSGYSEPGSPPLGATRWLTIARRRVTLAAGASIDIAVSETVPRSAAPGDYLSGVSVEALEQEAQGLATKGVAIASADRYAIGVESTVPGPRRPSIVFTGASLAREPAGVTFLLDARNRGNVILQGVYGAVMITSGRRTVVSEPIPAGTFVTGSSIAYPVNAFREHPARGTPYRVIAYLKYDGGIARLDVLLGFERAQAAKQQIYTNPSTTPASRGTPWWQYALPLAIALYGLIITLLLLARRRREREEEDAEVEPAGVHGEEHQRTLSA